MLPLANAFLDETQIFQAERRYPLHAFVCTNCFLVQLQEFASPEEIFGDYAYYSSFSSSWLAYCQKFATEIIDRLHPPRGKADQFPIPVELTTDEIKLALAGRMITKIVFLEQPQLAYPDAAPLPTATIDPWKNLLTEADRRGRPMAIVRIGSRQPNGEGDWSFIGRGGPLGVSK